MASGAALRQRRAGAENRKQHSSATEGATSADTVARGLPERLSGRVKLALILLRVLGSLCIVTQFDPDETWQSLEVAHDLVFGQGARTWEWWPEVRLRGCFHPMLVAAVYYFVALVGLDTRNVIVYAPRVAQAILVGCADIST
jgi:hypothetical protein